MRDAVHSAEGATGLRLFGLVLALSIGIGAIGGIATRPDVWFFALEKPALFPPQRLLSGAWLTYFFAMAYVGSYLWNLTKTNKNWRNIFGAWGLQMVCAWSWSIALYRGHSLLLALVVAVFGVVFAFCISWRTLRRERAILLASLVCAGWLCLLATLTLSLGLANVV